MLVICEKMQICDIVADYSRSAWPPDRRKYKTTGQRPPI